jgi:cytochrome P450
VTAGTRRSSVEFFEEANIQDPYPLYARMRVQAPVCPIGDSGFYGVCTWDAITEVLNRPEDFSANLTATMTYSADGTVVPFKLAPLGDPSHALATADDPAHALHRKLLVPQLAAKRIRAAGEFVSDSTAWLWGEGLHDNHIEWMACVANRLPMMVVARLIGVPAEDVDQLARWAYATTKLLDGLVDAKQLEATMTAALELSAYITEHFQTAASEPGDNLIGDLATACATGELEDTTALVMMATLFSAGGESTASLLGSAVWILATRPEIQQQVRDDPKLLGAFIEEVLRYEPPFRGHYRHVVGDASLGGVDLAAGSHLLLLWGSANRDPAHFEAPDEFHLDRLTGKGHITFGKGAHFCVGAALARLEAQIVVGMLLERTSWIDAADTGKWLPSILVRRLQRLKLAVR